jgi:hypothetical protein
MNALIRNIQVYINETLGIRVNPERWNLSDNLPLFLKDSYDFYQAEILDLQTLLMVARHPFDQTPATVKKHIQHVQKKWEGEVIYVTRQVKSYDRRRLIEYKVSFVVPGNQMYLPLLGLDLREHFKKARIESRHVSPSTQAVIIKALTHGTDRFLFSRELATELGYTSMTIIRAFDEIELHELGSSTYEGRERVLKIDLSRRELWDKSQNLMRSPVKKRLWLDYAAKPLLRIQAGLTALANYSMLAAPVQPVFAISSAEWRNIKLLKEVKELPASEPNSYEIEIWWYDPTISTRDGIVDPYSLYLSIKDDVDERVQSSLKEMMEHVQW